MITIYNDAFKPIPGNKPEAMGRPFSDIWVAAWDEVGPIVCAAYAGQGSVHQGFSA